MKTPILTLILSVMLFAPAVSMASDGKCCIDNLKTVSDTVPVAEEEIPLDLEAPFWFQEKVYIHIYDENDKPLISGAFSSQDLKENSELKNLLRKSTRYLSIDSHHYYMPKE